MDYVCSMPWEQAVIKAGGNDFYIYNEMLSKIASHYKRTINLLQQGKQILSGLVSLSNQRNAYLF